MNVLRTMIIASSVGLVSMTSWGATHYVSPAGTHVSPFTNWATASTNIQLAIDVCTNNEEVVIGDGTYTITNQIDIQKHLIVRSLNGPEHTVIQRQAQGADAPQHRIIYTTGPYYITLAGLTITNGYMVGPDSRGGGVWGGAGVTMSNCWLLGNFSGRGGGGACGVYEVRDCLVAYNSTTNVGGGLYAGRNYNCVIKHNEARYGGGVYTDDGALGAFYACLVISNTATWDGGGGYQVSFDNCLIAHNQADFSGGGAYKCGVSNSTVVYNEAVSGSGGGANAGTLRNSIIYYNTSSQPIAPDAFGGSIYNCCYYVLIPPASQYQSTTNPPLFVDAANGDFRLMSNSPCINTGNNAYSTSAYDLAGNARTNGNTVDMGAYEYYASASTFYTITASAGSHGSVTPSGSVQVEAGSNQTFVIAADEFYHVSDVLTNGSSAGAVTSLVWQSVSANGSLVASFTENLTSNNTPEVWLDAYYPGETNFGELAVSDTDSDGIPAWQECIAGTVPTNSQSKFVLTGIASREGIIAWSAVAGKTYSVEYTDNLKDVFQPLAGATGLVSGGSQMSYTNVNTSTSRVYRVIVER